MRRTTRRRLGQAGLYVALLAAIALVVLSADLTAIRDNFFDGAGWGSGGNWVDLITIGARNTVIYTLLAFAGGLLLAFVLAMMRLSPVAPVRWIGTAYVELFRGLPALLVILFMGFGVPIAFQWSPPGGPVGAGILALIMVGSAYMAETLRAGIQAVPKGQGEAARSLGMSAGRTMVSVTLPQAFRIVIPPLTNEFVLLIKDTALLSVIGVQIGQREITTVARDFLASGATAGTATSLVQAALLYLVITLPLTQLVAWLERRQRRSR